MTKKNKSLTKVNKEIIKIKERLLKINGEIKEGDFLISDSSDIYKVGKASVDDNYKDGYKHRVELLHKYSSDEEWHRYGDIDIQELESGRYVKLDIEKIEDFPAYEKRLLVEAINFDADKDEDKQDAGENTERALAILDKEFLLRQKKDVENVQRKFQILERVLERQRYDLKQYVDKMCEKIEKMNKVIGQIELYLGINEDIIQIQKGANADIKEPISLRQQILYMDEETGALLESGGLDYQNISQFDDWVTKNKNYEKLIPERKGVVVLRVRRNDKDYGSGDSLTEYFANQGNSYTYLLIRNGDNLYRIWANIIIKPRLFPTQEDMDDMYDEKKRKDFFGGKDIEDMVFSYRQNLLLLQGLIDRTQVFIPLPLKINLFKPESYGEFIRFIRDDEPSLTQGEMTFKDWKEKLNKKIERGTRIFFCGFSYNDVSSDKYSGFDCYRFPHRVEKNPDSGIYSIKKIEPKSEGNYRGETLTCHYKPTEKVWSGGYWRGEETDRKMSVPFYVYRDDWCVLNYDLITIKDIDYFLNSRFDRGNYLEMLPVLFGLKKRRLEEIKWERGFVDNLAVELKCDAKIIWKCIVWWKAKVIWKRPIMSDDSKALRMIRGRVKRVLKEMKGGN